MTDNEIVHTYAKLGAQLGAMCAVMAEAGRAFNASFDAAALRVRQHYGQAVRPLTPEQRERLSEIRYAARVDAERHAGLAHVRDHARQVRRELGLGR